MGALCSLSSVPSPLLPVLVSFPLVLLLRDISYAILLTLPVIDPV